MTIDFEQRKQIVTVDARESVDAALVEQALSDGADGFRPVVEKFQSAVFAVALSRIRDFHLAEDIAQQVFIEAFQKLDTLKEPEKLGGWLRTITVRKAVNAIRGGRREVEIEPDGSDGLLIGDANADIERLDLQRRVGKAIASLRETHREATTLFYIDGYSIGEIASILEVPAGPVKRRLHDARIKLKSEMVDLVKDTLTSEKPDENFGDQVHRMIREYATERDGYWFHAYHRIVALGLEGIDGLEQAMTSPHGDTRWLVPKLVVAFHRKAVSEEQRGGLVGILKLCLNDSSKKVRRAAVDAFFHLDLSEDRVRKEIIPLVIERLDDRSKAVQRKAASKLLGFADDVPLERVSMALGKLNPVGRPRRQNRNDMTERYLSRLVRKISHTKLQTNV